MFDLASLERELEGTIFSGKLHLLAVTESTNTDAMTAARGGAPHGSVWLADEQTAGRGRGDHRWHSAPGQGLYTSVLLRPEIPPERMALLPLAAGLAAAEAVRAAAGLHVDLRWPNDLLIGARKVGGILVESRIESKAPPYAVVGIGINVHQREFERNLATPATSLDMESGQRISRLALLVALLKSLEHEAANLADANRAAAIPERVARASTWARGRRVEVHGPQMCSGITAGLDENGFLLVQTSAGLVTVKTGGIREETASSG